MFRGLINDAKAAAGSLIAKYLARASVAVPFVIAFGFAIAAISMTLAERFGTIAAAWMIAGGFTLLGLVATLVVTVKEQDVEVAEEVAEQADTAGVATDAAAQAAVQAPLALLGALLSTPIGPGALAGGAKVVARNIPLVVLLALIGLLFWPTTSGTEEASQPVDEGDVPAPAPNFGHGVMANGHHREAA